jgi:hypothetical protein
MIFGIYTWKVREVKLGRGKGDTVMIGAKASYGRTRYGAPWLKSTMVEQKLLSLSFCGTRDVPSAAVTMLTLAFVLNA